MNDQYGNKVPNDLVVLPELDGLTDDVVKIIMSVDWYDVYLDQDPDPDESETIYLMASAEKIGCFENIIDIAELGGIFVDVVIINDILKRHDAGNEYGDGFYHA